MAVLKVIGSGSSGNGYAIETDNEILLLEAGCRAKEMKEAINFQISKVVGMFITHSHVDHCEYVRQYMNSGFPIYTNDETQEFIETKYGEKVIGIPEMKAVQVGKFKVTGFYLPHNGTPCFGYCIEHPETGRMVFLTDFELCEWNFKTKKLNHILIEANYSNDLIDYSSANTRHVLLGHCELETSLDFIESNITDSLKNVVLLHLSGRNSDEKEFCSAVQSIVGPVVNVEIAGKGKEIRL